ncbi:MAG TPA: phosphatase PAP2 family protein [Nocardioides sp.]|nr:phosphatase PAP2 family protein [Nocardioides sp.]
MAATCETAAPRSRRLSPRATALVELAVLVVLAIGYTVIRAAQGTDVELALAHGHDIARLEGWEFRDIDLPINHWLSSVAVLAVPACYFYAVFHYVVTPAVLVRSWREGGWVYRRGYWTLVLASAIALVVYARFPVAPPRLLPDLDSIDTMRQYAAYGWWGEAASAPRAIGDATNQYAAMPSLHFGWSLWCAIQMWSFGGTWWRRAAVVYPTLQVLVVIGTANHFLLDVVAGGACVGIALLVITLARNVLTAPQRSRTTRRSSQTGSSAS